MRLYSRLTAVIGLVLMLVACGFQLRGTYDLARGLSPVYVKSSERLLSQNLRSQLQLNGIATVSGNEASAAQLSIDKVKRSRRVISVDSSGRAREYELQYRLEYTLQYDIGNGAQSMQKTLELSRDLLFDPDAVLAINAEITTLYENMQLDASRIILRQLQAVQ